MTDLSKPKYQNPTIVYKPPVKGWAYKGATEETPHAGGGATRCDHHIAHEIMAMHAWPAPTVRSGHRAGARSGARVGRPRPPTRAAWTLWFETLMARGAGMDATGGDEVKLV